MDPLEVRRRNFYGIAAPGDDRNVTHYGQTVEDNVIHTIVDRLAQSSHYQERRKQVDEWNDTHRVVRRGLALTPVKFGISFTGHAAQPGRRARPRLPRRHRAGEPRRHRNGPGPLHQGRAGRCARARHRRRARPHDATPTDKVPNTSATAASSGARSQRRGACSTHACARSSPAVAAFAAGASMTVPERDASSSRTASLERRCLATRSPSSASSMRVHEAVSALARRLLSTPGIGYDKSKEAGQALLLLRVRRGGDRGRGRRLHGHEPRVVAVDILHDVGDSLNPASTAARSRAASSRAWAG